MSRAEKHLKLEKNERKLKSGTQRNHSIACDSEATMTIPTNRKDTDQTIMDDYAQTKRLTAHRMKKKRAHIERFTNDSFVFFFHALTYNIVLATIKATGVLQQCV